MTTIKSLDRTPKDGLCRVLCTHLDHNEVGLIMSPRRLCSSKSSKA